MRKKFINGLLMAVTIVATSVLVSCKDYESDYYAELQGQIDDQNYLLGVLQAAQVAQLKQDVKDLEDELDKLKANGATQEALEDSIASLYKRMNDEKCNCGYPADKAKILQDITNLQNTKADLADLITAKQVLRISIDSLGNVLNALADKEKADSLTLATAIDAANKQALAAAALAEQAKQLAEGKADTAIVNAIDKKVKDLESRVINLENRMTQVEKDAAEALALAQANALRLDAVEKGLEGALKRLDDAEADIDQLQKDLAQAQKDIEQNAKDLAEAKQKYDNALKVINEALASLQSQINNIEGLTMEQVQAYVKPIVDELSDRIKAVEDDLTDLKKKLNKVIDDMSNQIKNIILQGAVSPAVGYFALPVGIKSNILAAYYGEALATNADGEVEFPTDRTKLYAFPEEVISANAFNVIGGAGVITKQAFDKYIIDESEGNAGTLYLTINPAEKDFSGITPVLVDSRDNASGITLSPIAASSKLITYGFTKAERVYNGFYEAKATVDPAKIDEIKPNFDIESLKPLAKQILNRQIDLTNIYFTLQDQLQDVLVANGVKVEWEDTLGTHRVYSDYGVAATALPAFSYNFLADFGGKKFPTITPIGALDIDIDLNLSYSSTGTINYEVGDVYVMAGGVKYNVQGLDGLNGLVAQLNNAYADLNGDVNNLINQIETQVEDNMDDIEDDLNDRFIDRVNSVISKVNKVINRLNVYLENPNHLLQPFLAYESNGEYHHMSMSEAIPTEFKFAGGNAIELIPTSYTAEILAPAYQKFVAVTNVIAPDFSVSAQSGDATCQALADYVNKTDNFMNKVIPGKQTGIVFAPDPSHTEGYIYEITYAAVDYTGYNVAKKFYVRVK